MLTDRNLKITRPSTLFTMQFYQLSDSTYNHCYKGFLKLLIKHLGTDVDAREPAAIARVAVIPANCIF